MTTVTQREREGELSSRIKVKQKTEDVKNTGKVGDAVAGAANIWVNEGQKMKV